MTTKLNKILGKIPEDSDILLAEYRRFKALIKSLQKDKPYYVYEYYCPITNIPFYYGKGMNGRAWDHLFDYEKSKQNHSKNEYIKRLIEVHKEYPIITIHEYGLSETEAYDLEEKYISENEHIYFTPLTNILPGGNSFNTTREVSSYAGKIGGATTKSRGVGIFSDSHDRATETALRWANGVFDEGLEKLKLSGHFNKAAKASVASGKGIHAKDFDHSEQNRINHANMSEEKKKLRSENQSKAQKVRWAKLNTEEKALALSKMSDEFKSHQNRGRV